MSSVSNKPDPLQIDTDIGPATGNIDNPGDVCVGGGVCDLFELQSAGSIRVKGVIGAAQVTAGGDLLAEGGIAGNNTARCMVRGLIRSRHISNVTIEAYGDVIAENTLWESTVFCGGNISVNHGTIAASRIVAAGWVSCATLGLASSAATVVTAGVNEFFRRATARLVPAIEQLRNKHEKLKAAVAPLVRASKTLTASEKERTTELLFEADEVQTQIDAYLTELRTAAKRHAETPEPEILVNGTIFAGVTVRFPRCEARTCDAMAGRLRIRPRKTGAEYEIMVEEIDGGAMVALPAKKIDDPLRDSANLLLQNRVKSVAA